MSTASKPSIVGFAILLAVLLGLVDYMTGPFVSLTVFYLFPVALAAWYAGRREAILMSLFCALIWTVADFETFRTPLPLALDFWNGGVRLAFFVIVSYTLTTARRALDRETELAREIQQSLLPASLPRIDGVDIAAVYRPATSLSGDYFDVLPTDGGLILCIADVAGKGVGPALMMASLQAAVRVLVAAGRSPAELCEELNAFVGDRGVPSQFITFFVCRIDRESRRLTYSNAGHNPPIVFRGDGSRLLLSDGGLVLGVSTAPEYGEGELLLLPGDTLVLYTDGLTEARNRSGQEFGEQRVIDVLARNGGTAAGGLQARLIDEVERFNKDGFEDDVTLVVLSVGEHSGGGGRTKSESPISSKTLLQSAAWDTSETGH